MPEEEVSPWDALKLDQPHPDKEAMSNLKLQTVRHFKSTFGTDDGKWVLEYLNGLYFDRAVVNASDKNVMVSAAMRQGEQNVMHMIHRLLSYKGDENG